jgi:ParB family chromosome partitioning protein
METEYSHRDMKKRPALGKGIESLLGPRVPAPVVVAEPSGKPLEIELDRIDRNPHQTRTSFDETALAELAASIKATGVMQPVTVRAIAGGRYQLIMGERRLRASQLAGKATIPALVKQANDEQVMEMTIVENLQREDLNPMEQARAFEQLSRTFKMTQEQMAVRTGKDRASIGNFIRLLKLPIQIQTHVETAKLTMGHAKALLALESDDAMIAAAVKMIGLNLSVRQAEAMVQDLLAGGLGKKEKPTAKVRVLDPNVRAAEQRLREKLGLRVAIEDKAGKGRVVIEYSGVEEFDHILSALGEG